VIPTVERDASTGELREVCALCLVAWATDGATCDGCAFAPFDEDEETTAVMEAAGREGSGEADGLVDALRCAAPPLPRSP
jgi:hypothetical protein